MEITRGAALPVDNLTEDQKKFSIDKQSQANEAKRALQELATHFIAKRRCTTKTQQPEHIDVEPPDPVQGLSQTSQVGKMDPPDIKNLIAHADRTAGLANEAASQAFRGGGHTASSVKANISFSCIMLMQILSARSFGLLFGTDRNLTYTPLLRHSCPLDATTRFLISYVRLVGISLRRKAPLEEQPFWPVLICELTARWMFWLVRILLRTTNLSILLQR